MTPAQYGPLIGIGVALVVILLRNRAPRTLRPQWMWVLPAIFLPLILFGLWGMRQAPNADLGPYGAADWIILIVAAVLGAVAGWWRGKMIVIHKAPDGTLKAQASPLGLVLIVALVVGRSFLRPYVEGHAEAWGLNITAVEQAFLLFIGALIIAQRAEMWLRARTVSAGGADGHVETDRA